MASTRSRRFVHVAAVVIGLVLAVVFGMQFFDSSKSDSGKSDRQATASVRVKLVEGEVRVTLTTQEQIAAGISLAPLQSTTYQKRTSAFGTVVSPQALVEARRAYQAVVAEVDRVEIAVKAARLEVQRLQPLHREDRIVSDKAVETARVAVSAEETSLLLARGRLDVQAAALRQQWGPLLEGWLKEGTPQLERLLSGQDALLRIALPAGRYIVNPSAGQIDLPNESPQGVTVLSGVPDTDPKFQGQGFFGTAAANPRLLPGLIVPVTIASGPQLTGVVVPQAAIVWWQGRRFAFVELDQSAFALRQVTSEIAATDGALVATGFPDGARTVIRGAQLLLSEVITAQIGTQRP